MIYDGSFDKKKKWLMTLICMINAALKRGLMHLKS